MSYIDGIVVPVPRKNLAAYRKMATRAGKIWIEHGALELRLPGFTLPARIPCPPGRGP
jgi:uncharacterized protein YbaA (DUF1428 family)